MRRQTKWSALLASLLLGLLVPALTGTTATADTSAIERSAGTPFGISADDGFAVNAAAEKALGTRLRAGSQNGTKAVCNQPSYVQVFDPPTGQRLITNAPGGSMSTHAFTVLLHQGVTFPGTRAIFLYRWNSDSAGFDYFTTFSEGNCVMRQEPNPLSAQNFPVQNPVSVSVCFIPWEINQVVCGPLGTIVRNS
jgi:hypothetical protein